MTSWRDSTSQHTQDDLDGLCGAGLDAAEEFLRRNGEFFPFGVQVEESGETGLFAADLGDDEQPPSLAVLAALTEGARSQRDRLRAVGLVSDVSLQDGGDGIRVQLEHRDGTALDIVAPYRRRRLGGKVTLGDMSVGEGERPVWGG